MECFDISERAFKVANFSELKNYALIDLSALAENFRRVRELAGGRRVICVVKADAYGHGTVRCVRKLSECGADFFAVSSIEEALEVRIAAPSARVLIFGYVPSESIARAVADRMILTVYDSDSARRISDAVPPGMRAEIHIKLNTGMNRLGFPTDEAHLDQTVSEILRISSYPSLSPSGIYTHFAAADEPDSPLNIKQNERFRVALGLLSARGLSLESHAAASSGLLLGSGGGADGVRVGLLLWGLPPCDTEMPGFRPVMSLWSRAAEVFRLSPGETVSYGGTFRAEREMTVATLSLGYADGLLRAATGASLRIHGRDCRILGRICMDQFMIDATELSIGCGDFVPVFDPDGINVARLAARASTINYELVSGVGLRVPRIYSDGDSSDEGKQAK